MTVLDAAEAHTGPAEPSHRSPDGRRRLVVVGNGMAGARAVEEILERGGGEMFEMTVFGAEPYASYNRILLSNLLAGVEEEAGLMLNSADWYQENDIKVRSGVSVTRIDRFAKEVYADDGSTTPYDVLILATGSNSFLPPIKGMNDSDGELRPGVFGFRTLDDTRAMIAHAAEHQRGVVIGGGLLGLEAARGLQSHGITVDVLQAASTLMNQQLDADAGRVLESSIAALGITVHTSARITAVHGDGGDGAVTGVEIEGGPDGTESLPCDILVVAAGIRPNAELATVSGLTVERAIVVDDELRCVDDPDIYAVGECVQHRGEVYGLVAPLWEQATVLADQITGADPTSEYTGSRTATKLKVAGVDVASMGLQLPELEGDEHVVYREPSRGIYQSLVIRGDRLVGATLVGDVAKAAALMQAFDRGSPMPEQRIMALYDLGGASSTSAADLPDEAQVCNCNGVSKATLVKAVKDGATSQGALMDKTRAGKGCGSCKGSVKEILEAALGGEAEVDPSESYYVPGIALDKTELIARIREKELKSVSAVFAELAPEGVEDAKSKMGLASLLRMLWAEEYIDERDARFINDRVHGNIQRDGTFSVVPQMKGGVTTPGQLRKIADVAEKYSVPMVKVTGGQRIDLLGVPKEDLPNVWADLDMPSGYAYGKSFRTVKTCVGTDFCRFGLGDSTALGIELETHFQGLESPAKMKLAVVGCPRNCAEAYVKDIGVVAVGNGNWEVYVGGAAGASVRKGDLLATVGSPEEVLTLTGRFMQFYRENANWLERTYDFVPRLTIERLRKLIVDDSDGLAEGLDAAMESSRAAYKDPWKEGRDPAAPGQFRSALPLTVLPQVPVR
jgi:nitrite reductase (NADH) large subunit